MLRGALALELWIFRMLQERRHAQFSKGFWSGSELLKFLSRASFTLICFNAHWKLVSRQSRKYMDYPLPCSYCMEQKTSNLILQLHALSHEICYYRVSSSAHVSSFRAKSCSIREKSDYRPVDKDLSMSYWICFIWQISSPTSNNHYANCSLPIHTVDIDLRDGTAYWFSKENC